MHHKPSRVLSLPIVVFCLIWTTNALSQAAFPGQEPDSRTLKIQEKVDSLFERGKFERAYFIYRNELAPKGDKFAQYMVGYMHLAGKGVEEDPVLASAWFRLAAERNEETFVRVRDQLLNLMTPQQIEISDGKFSALREKFGDAAIIMKILEQDIERIEAKSNDELLFYDPFGSIELGYNGGEYGELAEKIHERLNYLEDSFAADSLRTEAEIERLADARRRIVKKLGGSEIPR